MPVLIAAALLLAIVGIAVADDGHRCTAAKLNGLYVFTASGFTNTLTAAQPKAIIELIRFDGDGNLDVAGGTVNINGQNIPIQGGGTGTYTVTDLDPPDGICVGTVTFLPSGPHFNSFIPLDGKEFSMIQTDSGNVFEGTVKKVFH